MDQLVVIITGASRGLGAAASRLVARMGGNVTLTARSGEDLSKVAQEIESNGGKALVVPGDISQEKDCQEIVKRTLERFGRIDGLINNGGTIHPIGPISDAQFNEWEKNWAVNVLGPVMLTQMALPSLREGGGRIINISSGAAENVIGGWGAYSAAKAALNILTRILAQEEPSVTALALRPGIVNTNMQAAIREQGKERMAEKNYHMLCSLYEQGRLLPPEMPGQAIACLALHAPHQWSGEFIQWDEPRVQQLVQTFFPAGG